ncbi:ShlB/FhaC/HecB family hemolysin secretion/activation protein [Nostoc sp. LEGE 12447]|uniref:ShlB/FhaC/HecB family hemolysin secretion/activation protein n=1 Tax=Nostoc sp. LEGE 12447 TaxID=1828640 RepID=UPI001883A9F7|nr:ShlB/FhaC/HecB family hemolysin secretion/activation protein [Nostoc sp. LEGE 12447]MBE9001071.1 ShlB/FhaC/HecB family hemolysin secretion/activation protein [Nostoc sp. LEGE 12447]
MSLHLLASLILTQAQIEPGRIYQQNPPTIQQIPQLPSPLAPTPSPLIPPASSTPLLPQRIIQPNNFVKIKVQGFRFQGNTVFNNQELEKVLSDFVGQEITFTDLSKISDKITDYYVEQGYINSGAYIGVAENQSLKAYNAIVTVSIVEGQIEKINIVGGQRLHNYIRARIPQPILNNQRLLSTLQLLQQDPLIEKITASLKEGAKPSQAILDINVQPRQEFNINIGLDNYRSPVIGTFQRRIDISHNNLLGLGDGLSISYRNTDGSNAIALGYSVPVNSNNGTIRFLYANITNNIIEQPLNSLDIVADALAYEISFRQPLIQQASANSAQELALGLTVSRLESESSLQNTPFPISAGADASGRTRIFALRFFQDWSNRSLTEALFARSTLSLGLDAMDSTINAIPPDGQFFSWVGEALWLKRLGNSNTSVAIRSRLQLADRPLPAFEQISLGGISTVRGYRQDTFISDNGFLLSTELRIPVWETTTQELQVIPFIDFGTSWNNSSDTFSPSGSLTSIGLALQYRSDRFNARLDWGIPLNEINSNSNTWQENGIYFSLNYQLF